MHRLGINSQWCVLTTVHSRASRPLRPGRAVVVVERVARPRLRLPECRRGRGGPYSDNTRPPEVRFSDNTDCNEIVCRKREAAGAPVY